MKFSTPTTQIIKILQRFDLTRHPLVPNNGGMGARWKCRLQVELLSDNIDLELLERLLNNIWLRSRPKLPDPCWIKGPDQSIYTSIKYNGKITHSHRVSFELFRQKKLLNFGCHHCDVPACINPNHIFDGTNKQNKKDADLKNRTYKHKSEIKGINKLIVNEINKDCRESISAINNLDKFSKHEIAIKDDFESIW